MRHDDVLTLKSGYTCEITHTDAEGRLALADQVSYATNELGAKIVIDIATLTVGRFKSNFLNSLGRSSFRNESILKCEFLIS